MAKNKKRFYMQKRNGGLEHIGPPQTEYVAWVAGIPDRTVLVCTYEKKRDDKTNPQLGYWFAVLMPFAVKAHLDQGINSLRAVEFKGQRIDIFIDEIEMDIFFKDIYQVVYSQRLRPKKADMTAEEMSKLIDLTVNYLAENLGAVAPPPKKGSDNE